MFANTLNPMAELIIAAQINHGDASFFACIESVDPSMDLFLLTTFMTAINEIIYYLKKLMTLLLLNGAATHFVVFSAPSPS